MSIDPQTVKKRWADIRNDKTCDLALDPESVARSLETLESTLVVQRIQESLAQLCSYRIKKKGFISYEPDSPGELATCEGLEAFLVPAVEDALPFSTFLKKLGGDKNENIETRQEFLTAIRGDIQGLLAQWETGRFSGQPYVNHEKMSKAVLPRLQSKHKDINITEAAAMACRVTVHLLTLKLNRSNEDIFVQEIGQHLDEARLFTALGKAIEFLIGAFQKGLGTDLDTQIANAMVGDSPGSGWSWTDHSNVPPMLFFTAAAVDAFAEVDLYLIRPAIGTEPARGPGFERLVDYHNKNKKQLEQFQLCVEMARLWVQDAILPDLSWGYGQYAEAFAQENNAAPKELEYKRDDPGYEKYKEELLRIEGMQHPPIVFYNNLYALLILLWSFGDRSDKGPKVNEEAKGRINRALAQLVYNYDSLPAVKQILNRFRYQFYLPDPGIFQPGERFDYLDSAFLPLLTRLLVLFVVYGVGDRNLLEPIIRDLYVELLQSRNRKEVEYSALWSSEGVEVFSTQRAMQALTFYFAYARGKEQVQRMGAVQDGGAGLTMLNSTGLKLVLEAKLKDSGAVPDDHGEVHADPTPPAAPSVPKIEEKTFKDYARKVLPGWDIPPLLKNDDTREFLIEVTQLGADILAVLKTQSIQDHGAARLLLNTLARIAADPEPDGKPRQRELDLLKEQYQDFLAGDSSGPRQ